MIKFAKVVFMVAMVLSSLYFIFSAGFVEWIGFPASYANALHISSMWIHIPAVAVVIVSIFNLWATCRIVLQWWKNRKTQQLNAA